MIKKNRFVKPSAKAMISKLILTTKALILVSIFVLMASAQMQRLSPEGSTTIFIYQNPTQITINDNDVASVYPSEITVAGITPGSGGIVVAVLIDGLTHTFPNDVDILLEGPTGARSIVMSDAGGGNSVNGLELVFFPGDPPISDNGPLVSGQFGSANYEGNDGTDDDFPSPGPGTLTSQSADLTVFNPTDPNGTWKLYVVDDQGQDVGEITDGWGLAIIVETNTATVTKTEDTNDGTCDADCSLREAIASGANQINFSSLFETPQTITLGGNELSINKSVIINGPGADKLTISGNDQSRVFNIINSGVNVTLDGITVSNGSAGSGGGIDNEGTLTILNSTVRNSSAVRFGGGIDNFNGTLTITNSTISNNLANDEGGGIFNGNALTITNSTISNNSADNTGGGIDNFFGKLTITHSTVSNNSSGAAGGIENDSGTVNSRNSIIANNSSPTSPDFSGMLNSNGYNLIESTSGTNITGDTTGNQTGVDPMLSSLGNYGGPTQTHALLPGSSAIDTGDRQGANDQRGQSLFDDAGVTNTTDGSDIGAFERQENDLTCNYSLSSTSANVGAGGGTGSVNVTVNTGCEWTAVSNDSWITVTGGASDNGDGTVGYSVSANTSPARSGTVTIAGNTFTVNQDGGCTYSLSDTSENVPNSSGSGSINLTTASGCTWSVSSNASWLTINSPTSGNGNTTINYSYTANTGVARSGIITAGGETFTVNQAEGCSYSINPTSTTAPAGGVSGTVAVTSGEGCNWTASSNANWITVTGGSTGSGNGSVGYTVSANTGSARTGTVTIAGETFTINQEGITSSGTAPFDYDGDGKTDIGIFRPNVGEWWYLRSSDLGNGALQFGSSTDIPVPADFTGDGKTDIAFWRNGEWFILRSEDDSFFSFPFGTTGDIPAPGDYDGDNISDVAVFRPSQSTWYILKITGGTDIIPFGVAEDKPVIADYDGDGKDDIAIYRPSVSEWWINQSTDGVTALQFGSSGDRTVQGDYTGDGKADVSFFRPSTGEWFIIRSEDSSFFSFPFGTANDVPAPGDYDGDGTYDTAVFRESETTWYLNTTSNGVQIVGFGLNGDIPVSSVYSRP